MVELFERDVKDEFTSSKGNQLKWKNGDFWYKTDYAGYEGLAEFACSKILELSSLNEDEYLKYETEKIKYKSTVFLGCRSKNLLKPGWQLITLERLIKMKTGQSIGASIYRLESYEDRLRFLEREAVRATGIEDFGLYLSKMITLDCFFLNEDRHTHNIAVLQDEEGKIHPCPYFDQGASLLSDTTMDYPMGEDIYKLIKAARSKTFCTDFDDALETADKLYGVNLRFSFGYMDMAKAIDSENNYPPEVKERVKAILAEQRRRYGYLFRDSLK